MRYIPKPLVLTMSIGIIALFFFSGCATQQQVKAIVAESNAAMVSPSLNIPESAQGEAWKEAVDKIDQLIASNPDQPVLVNHLKVRQAMLLTVNKQDSLAKARWERVDGTALQTERDKELFNNWECLVWWYKRASLADPLDDIEKEKTDGCIEGLKESIDGLDSPDIRIYLGTIRAQMVLKILNDSKINTPERRQKVVEGLSDGLEKYVNLFSELDNQWVKDNWKADTMPEEMTITDLRNASWLRQMIREFKNMAVSRRLEVVWKPVWIGQLQNGS